MPEPRMVAVLELPSGASKNPSPVPAYRVVGVRGSIAMHPMAMLAMKSSMGNHCAPPSTVRQMPPPAVPIHIVKGWLGCTTTARVRPPMLPGPIEVQLPG